MAKLTKEQYTLAEDGQDLTIDYADLRSAVLVLRAVNHDLRKDIIILLQRQENMTVTEIYVRLRVEQSVASQHLSVLRKAGIVIPTREGKFIRYSLNQERLELIAGLVNSLAN